MDCDLPFLDAGLVCTEAHMAAYTLLPVNHTNRGTAAEFILTKRSKQM